MIAPALKFLPALAPLVGGAAVLVWRYHETRTPVTPARILLPPLGMSTGLAMFAVPAMRVPWTWGAAAFLFGAAVLYWPLHRSSSLERRGDQVMMRRSRGFMAILLGLLALRLALHEWIGAALTPGRTAAVFYLLALGMILRWRIAMYLRYRRLSAGGDGGG